MIPKQRHRERDGLDLHELLPRTRARAVGLESREERALGRHEERLGVNGAVSGRDDPARGPPGERVGAPVARVRLQGS